MNHLGMHWPNGPEDKEILDLPSPWLLMLAPEARYHYDSARKLGKSVMWRGLPRVGKRPAELGYKNAKDNAKEVCNLWDEQPHYGTEYFVPYNELDLNYERGDEEDDFSNIRERLEKLSDFLDRLLPHVRNNLAVGTKVFFPPWTPDHGDIENSDVWEETARKYDGILVHAYGDAENIIRRLTWYYERFPTHPLFLGEWNSDSPAEVIAALDNFAKNCPNFLGATYFIWHWYNPAPWWPKEYNVNENEELKNLFYVSPRAYTVEEVVKEAINAADRHNISRRSLVGLLSAESGFKWNSARYAYRIDTDSYKNLTNEAESAIASADFGALERILLTITNAGSTDISFGVGQQTVRWADEGDHTQTVKNVLYIRSKYFDVPFAVDRAAAKISPYIRQYGNDLEALCRYNKPLLEGAKNPNRSKYERGLAKADEILSSLEGTMIVEQKLTTHSTEPFTATPKGFILHGSRSGVAGRPKETEYQGCVNWCLVNPDDLSWHATIGENKYAVHMNMKRWGWNARAASSKYIAVEFAQATVNEPITDAQVDAFVHFVKETVLPVWPTIPMVFVTHADVEKLGETGAIDGKTDVFPFKSKEAEELKARISSKLPLAPTNPSYSFQFGFEAKAQELGRDIVGDPIENEYYVGDHHSIQFTTTGIMMYSKEGNKVHFLKAE